MRRFALFALALALGAPACDDDSPTGPTSSGPVVFTAELRASNEVPAISNAESNAQGTVTITFDVPRDANGAVTGNGTWTVQAIVSNFTDTSAIQGLTHPQRTCGRQSAGVFVDTLLTPANAIPLTAGAGVINFVQVPDHAVAGAGRDGQSGRQLLQHAHAPQSGRSHSRPAHSGEIAQC